MIATLVLAACLQAPTLDADAGFQGAYFPDSWSRLTATVAYEGEPMEAELRFTVLSFACDPVVYRKPVPLSRKMRRRLGFDAYLTLSNYAMDVELIAKGRTLRKVSVQLKTLQDDSVRLLVVGTEPAFLTQAMAKKPPVTIVRLSAERLPPTAQSLKGVDAILIPEPLELDLDQEAALQDWVRQGGRLIFGAGRSTLLRQNPFWKSACPLEAPELGTAAVPGKDSDVSLTLLRGKVRRGRVTQTLGGDPLVIRDREGQGLQVFLTPLLEQDRLSAVLPSALLLAEVLDLPPAPPDPPPPRRGFVVRQPEWLLGQRRETYTVETREFLRRLIPSDWALNFGGLALGAGLVLVYVVLIGPVEYLRLRRSARLKSGWRSLLLIIGVCSGLVYVWSRVISPQSSRAVLVTLLDADRVQTYAAIRPSRGEVYAVAAPGPLSPLAPPRAYGAPVSPEPILVTPPGEARLPIPPSETRLLVAGRPRSSDESAPSAVWSDAAKKAILLRNPTDLALEECWAVSKDLVWKLPPVAAGSSATLACEKPLPFKDWALLQIGATQENYSWIYEQSPWGLVSAPRVGAILTFHEEICDVLRTGRTRYLLRERGLDWTPFLRSGGAAIVGSFRKNVSAIEISPGVEPQVYGWVRIRVGEVAP